MFLRGKAPVGKIAAAVQVKRFCFRASANVRGSVQESKTAAVASTALPPDSMTRYPSFRSVPGLLRGADYAGTVVFAASGAITAGTMGLDLLGGSIVGVITAIGGGSFRDAIILNKAPFWTSEVEYFWIAALVSATTFLSWQSIPDDNILKGPHGEEGPLLWWGDALGVGAFAVVGAMNGMRANLAPILVATCGMVTATFGGLTRDVLCGLPNEKQGHGRILHSEAEVYASTAFFSSCVYTLSRKLRAAAPVCITLGVFSGIGARFFATRGNVRLPTWESIEEDEHKIESGVE